MCSTTFISFLLAQSLFLCNISGTQGKQYRETITLIVWSFSVMVLSQWLFSCDWPLTYWSELIFWTGKVHKLFSKQYLPLIPIIFHCFSPILYCWQVLQYGMGGYIISIFIISSHWQNSRNLWSIGPFGLFIQLYWWVDVISVSVCLSDEISWLVASFDPFDNCTEWVTGFIIFSFHLSVCCSS